MFAVVFIPNFRLQAVLRHEPETASRAVALMDTETPTVLELTAASRARGVCEGLTASQALGRCGELVIKSRSPSQEQAAAEVLLQTAYAFSPNIEATAPGACTIALNGLGLQQEAAAERWAGKILEALRQFHLEGQIGSAATPALALLAARAARPLLLAPHSMDCIARQPVAALEPPPEIVDILHRWGIRTVGELLALGKDAVAERLGPVAAALFDRLSIHSVRPLQLAAPPEEFSEQMEFGHEIETAEPLLFVLRRFVDQLARRLELVYLVIAEFQMRLGLSSGASYERVFNIPAPTGNIETLFRILQTHLETVRTDSPIVSLRLGAKPARPDSHQFGLFEATLRDPNRFAETLGRLTALCGAGRVGTPHLAATHEPDAFRVTPPDFGAAMELSGMNRCDFPARGLQLRRFRPAISAKVEFRGERPVQVESEACRGRIVKARGPYRSSGNWWDERRWGREEWDVQTPTGAIYRLFRCGDGSFVEGIYD
jgi:protein ImuB